MRAMAHSFYQSSNNFNNKFPEKAEIGADAARNAYLVRRADAPALLNEFCCGKKDFVS
jgi:hypothetical protein